MAVPPKPPTPSNQPHQTGVNPVSPQGVPPPPPPSNVAGGVSHLAQPGAAGLRPTIGVKGEPIDDGERDPDTIAEEQRKRSDDMEKEGMSKWIAAHDERKGEQAEPRKVTATVQIEGHKAP